MVDGYLGEPTCKEVTYRIESWDGTVQGANIQEYDLALRTARHLASRTSKTWYVICDDDDGVTEIRP